MVSRYRGTRKSDCEIRTEEVRINIIDRIERFVRYRDQRHLSPVGESRDRPRLFAYALVFSDRKFSIHRWNLNRFLRAVGPSDLNLIYAGRGAQTEVQGGVVLR